MKSKKFLAAASLLTLLTGCVTMVPSRQKNYAHKTPIIKSDGTIYNLDKNDLLVKKPLERYLKDISIGKKLIAAKPTDKKGYSIVGTAHYYIWLYYSRSQSDLDKAISMLEKNIEIDPTDFYPHLALSEINHVFGNYQQELAELDKAISKKPNNPSLYYDKSLILKRLGRMEEALEAKKIAEQLAEERKKKKR